MIGWAGSALLVWSLLQTRILRLRALNLTGCLVLVGFNGALRVWPMVGLNAVLALINGWYLVRMLRTRHDQGTYQVVEVGLDDAFLAHTLRVHAADIARFNPGFRSPGGQVDDRAHERGGDRAPERAGDRPAGSAFLVVRGDEVVGIVLVRPVGVGVAQVELDYVTQPFRDLTPGEFVYRRSRWFTERGFRKVITPPGMVAPYYGRLGFRREGDSYVLDLPGPEPDLAA